LFRQIFTSNPSSIFTFYFARAFLGVIGGPTAATPQFFRDHFRKKIPHPSILNQLYSNASFVLEYCLRDNPPFEDLYGLQLIPLEDGLTLGAFGGHTDPPLYLASDYERKLLQKVGQVNGFPLII
jgi:hypothetical protein